MMAFLTENDFMSAIVQDVGLHWLVNLIKSISKGLMPRRIAGRISFVSFRSQHDHFLAGGFRML